MLDGFLLCLSKRSDCEQRVLSTQPSPLISSPLHHVAACTFCDVHTKQGTTHPVRDNDTVPLYWSDSAGGAGGAVRTARQFIVTELLVAYRVNYMG